MDILCCIGRAILDLLTLVNLGEIFGFFVFYSDANTNNFERGAPSENGLSFVFIQSSLYPIINPPSSGEISSDSVFFSMISS